MPRWSDMAWWRLQRQLFAQEMTEPVMEVLLMGGAQGANLMPPGLDVLVDWDVFNREALEWMRRYLAVDPLPGMGDGQMYTLNQVNEVSRRQTVEEIEFWMREGQALPVLQERLAPIYGKERAKRIAVTEVTRVYSEGNHMAWKASGIVNGLRWMTAKDERVCPICGALNGTIVDIEGGWTFTPEMLAQNPELERALRNPQSIRRPPAHVGCRCWLQPVIFEAYDPAELERQRFGAAWYKRWYEAYGARQIVPVEMFNAG